MDSSLKLQLLLLCKAIENKNLKITRTLLGQLESYVNNKIPSNEDGHTPLHKVAKLGDKEILKLFSVNKSVNFNVRDNHGRTALHYVIERKNFEEAQILIEAGAEMIAQCENDKSPLHFLIEMKVNSETIESLINLKNRRGENSLFAAVRCGNIEMMKLLIDFGCDINCLDYFGSTLLHQAVKSNIDDSHFEVAEILLKSGLDVNAQTKDENTALHYLVDKACSAKIIELFLNSKANVNIKNDKGEIPLFQAIGSRNVSAMQLLIDHGSLLYSVSNNGSTLLHQLAKSNIGDSHLEVAKVLMKSGLNVFAQDELKNTALHYLVQNANAKMMDLFTDFKYGVNIKNDKGEIPLFKAIKGGNLEAVKSLIDHGSHINSVSQDGSTVLHKLARCNNANSHFHIAELLLKNGASVNTRDAVGKTPLHFLVEKGKVEIVELFLAFKANIHMKNKRGEVPFFSAVRHGNFDILQFLLNLGSDVNSKEYETGSTPLHLAATITRSDDNLSTVELLLKNGAEVNAQDKRGRTPLHNLVRFYNNNVKTTKILLKNGAHPSALRVEKQTKLSVLLKESWLKYFSVNTLLYLFNYSDFNLNNYTVSVNLEHYDAKIVLEHFAKLHALNVSINQGFLKIISNRAEYRDYFVKCTKELTVAKSTKLKDCWVTFFNILTDDRRKLKNYAGNTDLIEEFEKSDCTKTYPIYGSTMQENLEKGKKRRKLFDESAEVLSNNWPIFGPTHLVIRDILDCLATKDLSKFCN